MRIWHQDLIPKLCQKHLCAMWREGLGCYKILNEGKKGYRNHPATKEFEFHLDLLWDRLLLVREEMLKRGYHPKEMPYFTLFQAISPIIYDEQKTNIGIDLFSERSPYKPWQTLEEQIKVIKLKKCNCKL